MLQHKQSLETLLWALILRSSASSLVGITQKLGGIGTIPRINGIQDLVLLDQISVRASQHHDLAFLSTLAPSSHITLHGSNLFFLCLTPVCKEEESIFSYYYLARLHVCSASNQSTLGGAWILVSRLRKTPLTA